MIEVLKNELRCLGFDWVKSDKKRSVKLSIVEVFGLGDQNSFTLVESALNDELNSRTFCSLLMV